MEYTGELNHSNHQTESSINWTESSPKLTKGIKKRAHTLLTKYNYKFTSDGIEIPEPNTDEMADQNIRILSHQDARFFSENGRNIMQFAGQVYVEFDFFGLSNEEYEHMEEGGYDIPIIMVKEKSKIACYCKLADLAGIFWNRAIQLAIPANQESEGNIHRLAS